MILGHFEIENVRTVLKLAPVLTGKNPGITLHSSQEGESAKASVIPELGHLGEVFSQ